MKGWWLSKALVTMPKIVFKRNANGNVTTFVTNMYFCEKFHFFLLFLVAKLSRKNVLNFTPKFQNYVD